MGKSRLFKVQQSRQAFSVAATNSCMVRTDQEHQELPTVHRLGGMWVVLGVASPNTGELQRSETLAEPFAQITRK